MYSIGSQDILADEGSIVLGFLALEAFVVGQGLGCYLSDGLGSVKCNMRGKHDVLKLRQFGEDWFICEPLLGLIVVYIPEDGNEILNKQILMLLCVSFEDIQCHSPHLLFFQSLQK